MTAAKAINTYLASWKRKGSQLEGSRVETLETIEGSHGERWLAHLQLSTPGTFSARIFEIDHIGRAHPEPGHRFSPEDLYLEEVRQAEPVAAQEGGIA